MALDPDLINNLEADALALGHVVNDAVGTANPGHAAGTVTTRGGGVVKNLAKTMQDAAGRVGLQYNFAAGNDTTIDPGQGNVRINAPAPADVTEIVLSALDYLGLSFAGDIAGWDQSSTLLNRGTLTIRKLDGSAAMSFRIVGATIAGGGFYRLHVAHKSSTGAFAAGNEVALLFVPTGDRGGNNYAFSGWFPGDALPASGEALLRHYFETDVLLPANLPLSSISSKAAASEDAVYVIKSFASINDTDGTVRGAGTIAEGEKLATFASAEYIAPAGTFLEVRAPDPPVPGILDLQILIVGSQVVT